MRKNLIQARKDTHMTQAEMASHIGLTLRQYTRLEAGTSDGSVKVWYKLKDLLHQPIDYLLEQET